MLFEIKDSYKRNLYTAACKRCQEKISNGTPMLESVNSVAEKFSPIIPEDKQTIIDVLEEEISHDSEQSVFISDEEGRTRTWWTDWKAKPENNPIYSERFLDYLNAQPDWGLNAVKRIDESTDELMNKLADPTRNMPEEKRGLVYGDVQSGKTAHYISLINKAYSAGYKIIIVLTGMHNNLRSQTQTRIDAEVLGYETSSDISAEDAPKRTSIGVAKFVPNTAPGLNVLQSFTTKDENGDVNKIKAEIALCPPFIIVTKKNSTVLKYLIEKYFMKAPYHETKNGKSIIPAKYPALIIDDEADQASINTKKVVDEDSKPSVINGRIRQLLNLFECKSYVAYTATPFANIFIPRSNNSEYGKDLYPSNFITMIPRADTYIGAKEFFGIKDEETFVMPLTRFISETDYPAKDSKETGVIGEMPIDLKKAIISFFISCALRNLRGQRNKPNTMLVHVVRYIDQQNAIKNQIKKYVEELRDAVAGGDEDTKNEFERIYCSDYIRTSTEMRTDFQKYVQDSAYCPPFLTIIWPELRHLMNANEFWIMAINGKSEESLIYEKYKDQPFNVIVIGGDKLSRGLTLKGLTVSYFTRSASAMDTLMQMGRWFGYRPGYLDVCRLYTTKSLYSKFKIVSYSTANLVEQFKDMNAFKLDPEHFGLKVATNPEILISSKNKIKTGMEFKTDFSNSLTQTRIIDNDPGTIENNYYAVDDLLSNIDMYRLNVTGAKTYKDETGRESSAEKYYWFHVVPSPVIKFLRAYETSPYAIKASSKHIADYIESMNKCGDLRDWTICLCAGKGPKSSIIATHSEFGPLHIHGHYRNMDKEDEDVTDDQMHTVDIGATISGEDKYIDLDKKTYKQVKLMREQKKSDPEIRREVRGRQNGLLLLYPIEKAASTLKTENGRAPYAFVIILPDREGRGELKSYRYNEVAIELGDAESDYE